MFCIKLCNLIGNNESFNVIHIVELSIFHMERGYFKRLKIKLLTIGGLLEIHVSITQRSSCDQIPANTDRKNGASSWKFFKKHGLGYIGMQIPDVQRRHRVIWGAWIHFLAATLEIQTLDKHMKRKKKIFLSFVILLFFPLFLRFFLVFFKSFFLFFCIFKLIISQF